MGFFGGICWQLCWQYFAFRGHGQQLTRKQEKKTKEVHSNLSQRKVWRKTVGNKNSYKRYQTNDTSEAVAEF